MLASTNKTIVSFRAIALLILALGIFLCSLSFILAEYQYQQDWRSQRREVNARNQNLALALEQTINISFAQHDAILRAIKADMETDGALDTANTRLLKDYLQQGYYNQISVADSQGELVYSAVPSREADNIANSPVFLAHKNSDSGKMDIAVGKESEAGETASLLLSYRLNDIGGKFDGIVSIEIGPDYFAKMIKQLQPGTYDSFVLLSVDGAFFARVPSTKLAEIKASYRVHPALDKIKQGVSSAVYEMQGFADGVVRVGAFHKLADYPAVVLVGIAKAEAFREVEERGANYREWAGLFSLLMSLMLLILWWQVRRNYQAKAELQEANASLELKVAERTREIKEASEELAAQNHELTAQNEEIIAMNDEIEVLNENLTTMNASLEARVAERTADLTAAHQELTAQFEELRSAQEDLRDTDDHLQKLIQYANAPIIVWNPDLIITRFNRAFELLSGYNREEVVGGPVSVLFSRDSLGEKIFLPSPERSGLQWDSVEIPIRHKNGEVRVTQWNSANIYAADGVTLTDVIAQGQDITARVRAEESLLQKTEMIRHMAYYDSLTNLPNRRYLHERLSEELEKARRYSSYGAVFFIDLDDLKLVNDTYGHTCGDEIIVESGARIVAEVGIKTFVSRLGGDEFIAILPGENDHQQVSDIADRILQTLGQKHQMYGTYFHMTASLGIAFYPTDGDSVEELIKNVDNAMYAAKNKGKNCWRFYSADMQAEKYQQMQLTNSLRYAIENNELSLHYQPQIKTIDNSVLGFEALLRWNSAEHGMVSPIQFIPLAEQSDLIYPIGQWVLQEACRFVRRLSDQGWGQIRVAVNVSAKQLIADDFTAIVCQTFQEAGIKPEQLELEITESLLMVSIEEAINKLNEVKRLGVKISLDDFGTGYSSLTYLRKLPIDTVKIDKTFIDAITTDEHVSQLIGAIINMAHVLEMTVIAEGVEMDPQFKQLTFHGCDCVQGYLFSRPMPEAETIQYLMKMGVQK